MVILVLRESFGSSVDLGFANIIDGGGVWGVVIDGKNLVLDQSSRGGAITIRAKDSLGGRVVERVAEALEREIASARG